MKIAVPSTGEGLNSTLDTRFGRCKGFMIIDREANTVSYMANGAQAQGGGAGISASQAIIDMGVDVVISGNLGPNALRVLKSADIKTMRCDAVSIEEALKRFDAGDLDEISTPGAAHVGMRR